MCRTRIPAAIGIAAVLGVLFSSELAWGQFADSHRRSMGNLNPNPPRQSMGNLLPQTPLPETPVQQEPAGRPAVTVPREYYPAYFYGPDGMVYQLPYGYPGTSYHYGSGYPYFYYAPGYTPYSTQTRPFYPGRTQFGPAAARRFMLGVGR